MECKCKEGFYEENDECWKCDPRCDTCEGKTNEDCLTCSIFALEEKQGQQLTCHCPNNSEYDYATAKCIFML